MKLSEATNGTDDLWQAARKLFERSLTREMLPVRLLGVGAGRLTRETAVQGDLFDGNMRERQNALDRTIDDIRGQFGSEAIQRGILMGRKDDEGSAG